MVASRETEIERNYQYFVTHVTALLPQHRGRYALLRHEGVIEIYDELIDAFVAGHSQFADGMFSIQEVTDVPLDLGFYSHADPQGPIC